MCTRERPDFAYQRHHQQIPLIISKNSARTVSMSHLNSRKSTITFSPERYDEFSFFYIHDRERFKGNEKVHAIGRLCDDWRSPLEERRLERPFAVAPHHHRHHSQRQPPPLSLPTHISLHLQHFLFPLPSQTVATFFSSFVERFLGSSLPRPFELHAVPWEFLPPVTTTTTCIDQRRNLLSFSPLIGYPFLPPFSLSFVTLSFSFPCKV